jgi:hypothetical protein
LTVEKVTYCRICEPLCGMVATVEEGRMAHLNGIAVRIDAAADRPPAPAAS